MLICYQHTKQIANSYGGIGRWRARTRARGREGRYKYPSQQKRTINTHVCVRLRVCVIQLAALGALTNDVNAAQAQPCLAYPPKKGLAGSLLFIRRENIKQTTG